ncbi:hypothetical protein T10_5501 [Trichinella papuae]|uniref:Secreted protein n=1 Tax=Trichinella papuae TaxID=268474 RepID=A0A0V1M6L2_9BILA|nr:hypothetical protein T10_5501 [Trichinella papuae]
MGVIIALFSASVRSFSAGSAVQHAWCQTVLTTSSIGSWLHSIAQAERCDRKCLNVRHMRFSSHLPLPPPPARRVGKKDESFDPCKRLVR